MQVIAVPRSMNKAVFFVDLDLIWSADTNETPPKGMLNLQPVIPVKSRQRIERRIKE